MLLEIATEIMLEKSILHENCKLCVRHGAWYEQ